MCGRFNLRVSSKELQEFFELFSVVDFTPRYNIAPMQPVVVILADAEGHRLGLEHRWGLVPHWSADTSRASDLINARSETASVKPHFRHALLEQRCLIPASGFYEWEAIRKGVKQPWHITLRDEPIMAFAGLWDRFLLPDGNPLMTCTILTTSANTLLQPLHERMPVILPRESWKYWLDISENDTAKLASLFQTYPAELMTRQSVSPIVNSVQHEGPDCIKPVSSQLSLF